MEDVHGKQKEASTDTASECQDMFQVSCFSRALFSVCDDSNTDEGEREREREGGRWKEGGSAFARLSAYGLSKEQRKRKMTEERERSCVNALCRGDAVASWVLLLLSAAPAHTPFQWQNASLLMPQINVVGVCVCV